MADFRPVNLAEIYQAADASNLRRAQMDAYQRQAAQEQKALQEQDAVKGAYAIGPDGQLDEKTTLSNLYRVSPAKAYEFKTGVDKSRVESMKANTEAQKAKLEQNKALLAYGRDRLSQINSQEEYDALRQELAANGAPFAASMSPTFSPEIKQQYIMTADEAIKQSTPKYERVDLGGKVQVIDTNPYTNPSIKGTALDKTATPEAIMTDRRTREENALNRAVTMRGQNMTAATAQAKSTAPQKTALSASAQKELFEADELAKSSENAIGMLTQALELNKKAYSGIGAKPLAVVRSNLPGFGESEAANSTIDLDNLMTGQALESLKATFGGMPTEGERKILLDIQASADKTPAQRKIIIDRAIEMAKKRMKFNKSKADALRKGTYFTDGVVEKAAPQQPSVIDFGSLK